MDSECGRGARACAKAGKQQPAGEAVHTLQRGRANMCRQGLGPGVHGGHPR
jgi:hypothetical protein